MTTYVITVHECEDGQAGEEVAAYVASAADREAIIGRIQAAWPGAITRVRRADSPADIR